MDDLEKRYSVVLVGGPFDGQVIKTTLPISMVKLYTDDGPPENVKRKPGVFVARNGFIAVYDEGDMHTWGTFINEQTGEHYSNEDELRKYLEDGWPLLYNQEKSRVDPLNPWD